MTESLPQDVSTDLDQAFRPAKRRKFYRKRDHGDDNDDDSNLKASPRERSTAPPSLDELAINQVETDINLQMHTEGNIVPIADILRLRKAAQRKKGGIEFTNTISTSKIAVDGTQLKNPALECDNAVIDLDRVGGRFAPQNGQVADVDKHMMAYIDYELAKRRQGQETENASNGYGARGSTRGSSVNDTALNRQPAALGKLHEIDLGPDATLKNIAMTEAARRRLEGEIEDEDLGTGKVRLRRDGKPWRGRRRRNSEDVKRDQLVEQVMKESRLEIYDEPEPDARNDDQAADDRIAEQFRREFMDAISSRRQRTGAASATKAAKGAKVDDRPKGPKLGGSRSARAAMRELQEKAAKK